MLSNIIVQKATQLCTFCTS